MKDFLRFVGSSLLTLLKARLWPIIASAVFIFSLTLVSLTLTSSTALQEGTDSGRMGRSFIVYLVLVAVIFGVPSVFAMARGQLGRAGFLRTLALTAAVGFSFVLAAIPASVISAIVGGIDFAQWFPVVGTLHLEVWVVSVLVALAFATVRREGAAAITAFGLITGLTVLPLILAASAGLAPGVEQTIRRSYVDYGKGDVAIDPATGFPIDPTCLPAESERRLVTRYDTVWPVLALNPLVLVSASVPPKLTTFVNPDFEYDTTTVEPVDLFGTVDLAVRRMQLPIQTDITIDECANIMIFGTPYPSGYDGTYNPAYVIDNSTSSLGVGLLGQAAYLAVASAALVFIGRRSRR